jgi:ligand-binding sensor domain-containing protein
MRVTALRAAAGELLVGTFDAGLFEFDGATFTRRYQRTLGDGCRRVTSILAEGPRLYVGTFDAGLFEWRESTVHTYGERDGLPSARVTGLAARSGSILVATDLGVALLDGGDRAKPLDTTPNATGIAVRGEDAWVASLSRGVARLDRDASAAPLPTRPVADGPVSPPVMGGVGSSASGVKFEDGVLWAMTPTGLFAATAPDGPARFERFDEPDARRSGLDAGHVAALAVDGRGRLWAGLFDGGIDVLDPTTGERLDRVDDAALHEINAIVAEPGSDRTWVASSRGLAAFDGGRRTRLLGEREGLIGDNAAGIALDAGENDSGVAVATNKGLSVIDGAVARSITAFHGLPNNHAYAVAVANGRTYVGTLGGLAEVQGLRVARIFTTADSKLPHNWVNAVAALDGRVYVGTYGGGVATLMPTGDLVPAEETAGLEVNPGAMAIVGRRLYVGTLRSGLWALDVDTGRWTKITAVLASTNVTAIAADAAYLYVGTEHGITRIERTALS